MADVNVLMIDNGPLQVIGGIAFVDDATGFDGSPAESDEAA